MSISDNLRERLKQSFYESLIQGENHERITQARTQAEAILGTAIASGSPLTKIVDEAMEASVVRAARQLVGRSTTTHKAYDALVNLLEQQPRLSVRSSTSVLQQAYSTPVPIAYLASVLANINAETWVYEPTAGNGALLIGANPDKVIANELNGDRLTELSTKGYNQMTQKDATTYRPRQAVDRVICNPPFGTVQGIDRRPKRFPLYDTYTTQIDHVIAFNALSILKDEGRAVLILGGKLGADDESRSQRYNSRESRAFYYLLYRHYNVTHHLAIWGDLYRKQGAGFPIDLIVIQGRGRSQLPLPAAQVPTLYKSFDELKEQLPNERILSNPSYEPVRPLSSSLATQRHALTLPGQSPRLDREPGRADLQNLDATANGLDDSAVDGRSHSTANPETPDNQTQRNEFHPGSSNHRPGRERERSRSLEPLAGVVGRDADLLQRHFQESDRPPDDRLLNARDEREPPRVSRLAGTAPGNQPGRMAERSECIRMKEVNEMDETQAIDNQPKQVPYTPRSTGISTDTLIPYNMASAAQSALDRFEQQYGNIDEYLVLRLGYASVAELHQYFSAEQVDASALAISNIERGAGFITGDQTGVGKGRICASILRYAQQQGKAAIFVTQNKTLYADMMRDVSDIGLYGFNPFITDTKAVIPLADGRELTTGGASQQTETMREMMQTRSTGMFYNAVFTTYSQLQTVKKKEPLRREFLRAIVPNAILILDEAHEAGGSVGWQVEGAPDRAEFVRELVDTASGVFYSSATYAKRPEVMDLYARRTDLRLSVKSMGTLENLLNQGGVPLQQIVASKFVASGQMLRRERSYEGISFQAQVVAVDREVADQFSAAMRAIKDFDRAKQEALKELNKQLKAEAKAMGVDSAIGDVGAKSTQFTSLMHNCIEQGLLAQKAEATVLEAIHSLQTGQKPVIAVANTMGSFIQAFAEMNEIQNGNVVNISFADLLRRYLERSRDVLIKDYRGTMTRQRLTDGELGEEAIAAYEDALEWIEESDFSSIPVSPIDYITQRLEREGYSVREVTGRSAALDYLPNGTTTYRIRPDSERTSKARISAVADFNSGRADVIILNCSGSTGISLHASERFADQRPRHMIVAQAERDINVFMQMLGRVHRTGQVALPSYTLLMGDLPAEKRPGAILCRKMAGLNANTTAARETDISITNVVDFMNPYGEQVVMELLSNDPELEAMLDFPLAQSQTDLSDCGLTKRVTGRIPLLPIAQQEAVYSLIESEYRDLVEQQRAMGESILEADQLDLDARTVARMEVIPDQSTVRSEFTGAVYLEVVNAKGSAKPMTQLQVVNAVRDELGLTAVDAEGEHDRNAGSSIAQSRSMSLINQLTQKTNEYRQTIASQKRDEAIAAKFNEKMEKQLTQVTRILQRHPIGTPVRVATHNGNNIFYGVVAGIDQKARSGSPTAPNTWRLRIWVTDAAKQITLPFSKVNTGKDGSSVVDVQERDWFGHEIYGLFDQRQEVGRVDRQIFTGNLIKAFEKYPRGKLVNYTDNQGQVRQGLIMPRGFDIQESLQEEPVAFSNVQQVIVFLTELTERKGTVKTLDGMLTVRAQTFKDGFLLQAPKAKDVGGRYFLDELILDAVGSDFYSVSDRMEVIVPPDRLEQTLNVIMNQRQHTLAAFDRKEVARELLGIKLPEMELIAVEPLQEPQAQPVTVTASPVVQSPASPIEAPGDRQPIILPAKQQKGIIEKRIARLLEGAGIRQAVTADEDYHLKIENEPWIPLVVERHLDELYLTHYLTQNGDMFIDSEMVFKITSEGQLEFKEVATQDPFRGGEKRSPDRVFAQVFSRNILEQGFAETAKQQLQGREQKDSVPMVIASNLKELADQVRDTDLAIVAANLGLSPDRQDAHKWRDEGHIISISDSKFMDWAANRGGGGAIDLVMHIQQTDFQSAVQWLSGRSLMPIHHQSVEVQEARSLEMPIPDEQRWSAVREYLTETRKLSDKLIDSLHERGLIYADDLQNTVFVRHATTNQEGSWKRIEANGASLRGTWGENNSFHGLAPGSSREDGWFWVGLGKGTIQRVLLTESPIDALSLVMLDKPSRPKDGVTIYLSTDGAGAIPAEALRQVMAQGGKVAIAFDADRAGELMSWRVAQELPGARRITPAYGKDWNERLIWDGQPENAPQPERDEQMGELWQWHRAAHEVGRAVGYLQRITEVARGVVQGEALSEQARNAMRQDLSAFEQGRSSRTSSQGKQPMAQCDRENGIE
jgi:hypothetical protein